jgi:hypothetical protein
MPDRFVQFMRHRLIANDANVQDMRERIAAVPDLEKPEIAHRASIMIRRAHEHGELARPLRGDLEDAIAMLLVLGVRRVDG